MEKRKKPRIRFKGFSDDWEQRKLGDVANSFEYGLNVAAKAYDGINKYIRITDIDDVSCKFLFNNLTSPNVNISEAINYQLKKGDILFARTGASVGKTYLYSEKDGMVFYAGFLIRAKISSSYDSNFIFQNTLTESYRRYIQITSQRSGQPGVNAQEYGEYKLMIPRLLEQKKIGNYFKYLDTLITLHQRKLEKLKIIKKSMLEKCFPKKGEKVPKIRFSGFTDDWEQRKLGDIFEEYSEKGFSDLPALTIIQGEGTIKREDSDRSLKYDKASLLKYKLVKKGDFIVHLRSFEGGLEISKNIGVVSPAYHTFHGEGTDSTFYYWHFRSDDFIDIALKPHVYGIRDGRSINIEGMKTIKIPWTTLDEQSRIGNLIKCINRLITLHQRKLNILKSVPKFLLGIVWEQRKLGDIVTRVIRKNENLESKLPLTISAQFGLIAQDEFFDKRIASKNISHYYLIRKGEFAYNKSTSMDAPWGAIKRLEHYDNGVLSTLYIMFRILDENKVNSDYIVSYYVTNLWHKGVREVAAEGARNHGLLNIAPVDFFETTLTIPSNENEQKNIGEYFRRLDRLITLHQRQQNLWKFVRKGVKLWIILTKNQILKRP